MHETPPIERVEGNTVYGKNSVTPTHTGPLDLSAMGVGAIPPTNRRAAMDLEVAWKVEDDRSTRMDLPLSSNNSAYNYQARADTRGRHSVSSSCMTSG